MPHRKPHPVVTRLALLAAIEGHTQVELADEDGVSRETWRSWISGRRSPSLDRLAERAATLGQQIKLVPIAASRDDADQPEGKPCCDKCAC